MKYIIIILTIVIFNSCHQKSSLFSNGDTSLSKEIIEAINKQTDVIKEQNKLIEEQNRILGDISHKMSSLEYQPLK